MIVISGKQLFVAKLIRSKIKTISKSPLLAYLRESTGERWISPHKEPLMQTSFPYIHVAMVYAGFTSAPQDCEDFVS